MSHLKTPLSVTQVVVMGQLRSWVGNLFYFIHFRRLLSVTNLIIFALEVCQWLCCHVPVVAHVPRVADPWRRPSCWSATIAMSNPSPLKKNMSSLCLRACHGVIMNSTVIISWKLWSTTCDKNSLVDAVMPRWSLVCCGATSTKMDSNRRVCVCVCASVWVCVCVCV